VPVPGPDHLPVMLAEVLAALAVRPGGLWVDGTLGRGGHAEPILEASAPDGRLVGIDQDDEAIEACRARLSGFAGRFELRRGNFSEMAAWVSPATCDGVLLDLGVSSPQLDLPERGFSFLRDGPLDMRMDRRQPLTAERLVNDLSESELADIFWKFGEERASRRIARAIEAERRVHPIRTTAQLACLVERVSPRGGRRSHPATQVFQALRMVVNDESRCLRSGLAAACLSLKPGGRLAVITFHSIEDRAVKDFGNERSRDYTFPGPVDVPELRVPRAPSMRWVQRKAITPSPSELESNPRARSAQLRVLEKIV
jgi:16S rRNA (cytosine1402-N4)-methyltransferase